MHPDYFYYTIKETGEDDFIYRSAAFEDREVMIADIIPRLKKDYSNDSYTITFMVETYRGNLRTHLPLSTIHANSFLSKVRGLVFKFDH